MENAEAIEMLNRNPTDAERSVYIGGENQPDNSDYGKALYIYIFSDLVSTKHFAGKLSAQFIASSILKSYLRRMYLESLHVLVINGSFLKVKHKSFTLK